MGLSAGGLIVVGRAELAGAEQFRPLSRLAGGLSGGAVRVWHLLSDAPRISPLVWDITIVPVYFLISVIYVWVYCRADLARAGSPLALGTGLSEAAHRRDERVKTALAYIGLPAAILLHSITAWIFGLQIARGFWYTAVMAPLFISSALVSGTGLMILLVLAVRRAGRISFRDDVVAYMAGLLAVFIPVEAFLMFSDMLTAAYPGAGFEADPIHRLISGPYAPFFWFEVLVGLAVPFVLLVRRRWRMDPHLVAVASMLAVVGIFVHRFNIVLNGLSYATVPFPPGVSIGTAQPVGTDSFTLSLFYHPALVEWLIAAGVIAFGALVFTAAVLILPMREQALAEVPREGH